MIAGDCKKIVSRYQDQKPVPYATIKDTVTLSHYDPNTADCHRRSPVTGRPLGGPYWLQVTGPLSRYMTKVTLNLLAFCIPFWTIIHDSAELSRELRR